MGLENLIIVVSLTILLSFASALIYRFTRIPDVVWLMGFGVLIGSGTHYIDKNLFTELAPLMSILALSIILFDAGINLDIVTLIDNMGKSLVLSVFSILLSIILVGSTIHILLPEKFTLAQGMLLGSMVGGTSTVAVFGVLGVLGESIPDMGSTRIMLTMESILSDPICIISSITIIKMIIRPDIGISEGIGDIVSTFVLSSILGVGIGLFWSNVLHRLRTHPYTYMVTLSVLLPTYILSEALVGDGSGAITALTFGLSITNYSFITRLLNRPGKVLINIRRLREFHEEIVFFIKSFFFVYIGAIVTISWRYLFIGFSIVILQMAMRYILVKAVSGPLRLSVVERSVSSFLYVSGLPAFVMSQLPQIYDPTGIYFPNPEVYPNICMPIVLGTILYGALLGPPLIKHEIETGTRSAEKSPEEPEA